MENWVVVMEVLSGDKDVEGLFTVVLEGNLVVIASDLEVNGEASVVNALCVVVWSIVFVVMGAAVVGLGVVVLSLVICVISSVVVVGGGATVVEFAVVTGGVDALVGAGVVMGSVGRGDVDPVVEGGRVGNGASSPGTKHCTCNLAPESSDRRPIQYLSSCGWNSLTNEIFPIVLFCSSTLPFKKHTFRITPDSCVLSMITSILDPQPS